jgi:predicted permease
VFVVLQLAVSLVLLVGAGLLARTFVHITAIDPGFDPSNVVTIDLALPRWKYSTADSQRHFFDQVLERLRATPGIAAAAVAGGTPPGGGGISFRLTFEIEGRGIVLDDPGLLMPFGEVDGNYFDVVGIPLKAGRTFSREDTPDGPRTMIISEVMARRLWKGDNPIGQRLRTDPSRPWYTVVGVVGDVYQLEVSQPRGLFAAYYPNTQSRGIAAQQTVVVRTDSDPLAMIPAIRQQIWTVDPDQPFIRIGPLADEYAEFFATPRFYAFLMISFAAIGLAITAVGLYGVLAFAIAQRTREFGIRMALGARPTDVRRLVLASGFVLVATGLVLGGAGSLLVTRALESLLVEVPRTDPLTYAVVTVALGAVALIACWIPARRATRVDPMVALRCE